MDRWEDMVLVGRIARPHGLRGDVLIAPETDFPEVRFAEGATLYARRGETMVALEIETSRVHAGKPLVGFRGLERIEDVEGLGRELRIPESSLVPLPEGEYYWYQYVGAPVQTEAGDAVGTVVRVEPTGGSGMLIVQRGSGRRVTRSPDSADAVDVPGAPPGSDRGAAARGTAGPEHPGAEAACASTS